MSRSVTDTGNSKALGAGQGHALHEGAPRAPRMGLGVRLVKSVVCVRVGRLGGHHSGGEGDKITEPRGTPVTRTVTDIPTRWPHESDGKVTRCLVARFASL